MVMSDISLISEVAAGIAFASMSIWWSIRQSRRASQMESELRWKISDLRNEVAELKDRIYEKHC